MALSGKRKAALLLMSLDPATAGELFKGLRAETQTEIAAEVAYLEALGQAQASAPDPIREFIGLLSGGARKAAPRRFLHQMLENSLGAQKGREVLAQVKNMVEARDPFLPLRDADVTELAKALEGESALVASVVLIELPERKCAALIPLLPAEVRPAAVRGMAAAEEISPETRLRIATAVRDRLAEMAEQARQAAASSGGAVVATPVGVDPRQARLRKVAVVLRGLKVEMRGSLLEGMSEQTRGQVQELMVLWEDLPVMPDRALQEALRTVDSRRLALALVKADAVAVKKARANISERAGAMLDEEASLLSAPKAEDIEAARQDILGALRQMSAKGELNFE